MTTTRKNGKPLPKGYEPKRHSLTSCGYVAPRWQNEDAYGCFNDAGAFLGVRRSYLDALELIDYGPPRSNIAPSYGACDKCKAQRVTRSGLCWTCTQAETATLEAAK